jgi:Mycoplasma protein of unknown function, DUF285
LYDAVDLYLAGSSTVPPIGEWNVGAITDFSSVFSAERNPAAKFFTVGDELNQWDTRNAASMKLMVRLSTTEANDSLSSASYRTCRSVFIVDSSFRLNRSMGIYPTGTPATCKTCLAWCVQVVAISFRRGYA